jgi:hypothetical protein
MAHQCYTIGHSIRSVGEFGDRLSAFYFWLEPFFHCHRKFDCARKRSDRRVGRVEWCRPITTARALLLARKAFHRRSDRRVIQYLWQIPPKMRAASG